MNEELLYEWLQKGDRRAIAYLYDKYADALYGVVLRIVPDEALAADIMQESFVKVWRNAQQFDPVKGRLFTWLLNIFRRTAIDKTRSKHFSQRKRTQILDKQTIGSSQFSVEFRPEHIGLEEMVGHLEPKYQSIIDLIYFQGMTQAEVQQELDIPLGTVKSRLRIGLRQLRQFFQEHTSLWAWLVPVSCLCLWILS